MSEYENVSPHKQSEWQYADRFENKVGRRPEHWEIPDTFEGCSCLRCRGYDGNGTGSYTDHSRSPENEQKVSRARQIRPGAILYALGVGEPIKKNGTWVSYCPFHDDTNPSLRIDREQGLWYCFPCGEGGDMIDLWMQLTDDGFLEAVEQISNLEGNNE